MDINKQLEEIREAGLERKLRALPCTGGKFTFEGRTVLNFSSNDYLNLTSHPEVTKASCQAIENFGSGATASRLMTGHLDIHQELESRLGDLIGKEAALVFGSGFLTNLGVITAITDKYSHIFADKLNHASLIDGVRLSKAECSRYRHKDMAHLERLLSKSDPEKNRIIISDSIFSMDGDIAPIAELVQLSEKYNCLLFIDEAHAIGIFGKGGGVIRELNLSDKVDLISGTMSKALGSYGGFVACSEELRQLLINKARSFIYSTGLPPACSGAVLEAINLIEENDLGPQLQEKTKAFHSMLSGAGFSMEEYRSQIIPIHVGGNQEAVDFSSDLFDQGIIATAVRPPTVPKGTARLRLTVTLAHQEADLKKATEIISASAKKLGII